MSRPGPAAALSSAPGFSEQSLRQRRGGQVEPTDLDLNGAPGRLTKEQEARLSRKRAIRRFKSLLHVLAWLGVAGFILVQSDFLNVLLFDSRVNRVALAFGLSSGAVFLAAMLYMVIWVPIREGVEIVDYNELTPHAIYTALVSWFGAFFSLCFAIWPIWGWFSPIMLGILGVALILSSRLVPSCRFCTKYCCKEYTADRRSRRYVQLSTLDSEDEAAELDALVRESSDRGKQD